MTALEHALVGGFLITALGGTKRYGWQLAAAGGVAAVLPDWDGLTLAGGIALFDQAHRVWGHGLLPCLAAAVVWAALDFRFDLVTRMTARLLRITRVEIPPSLTAPRSARGKAACGVWMLACMAAALTHPLSDMIVSGAEGLTDWEVPIFWPFSSRGFVYALIPWGDVGVLLIFTGAIFLMLRHRHRTQQIALGALFAAGLYAIVRGMI